MKYLVILLFLCITAGAEEKTVDTADAVQVLNAVGAVITAKSKPTFRITENNVSAVDYQVSDYYGKIVAQGAWPKAGRGVLQLDKMPCGYYYLTLHGPQKRCGFRSFAVLPDPRDYQVNQNSSYAVNSSQIWLACANAKNSRFPASGWSTVSALLSLGGFGSAREFVGWKEMWPEMNHYRWSKYDDNFTMINQAGTKVVGVYRDSPRWARYQAGRDDNSVAPAHIPDDLLLTYRFSRMLAERYKSRVAAWEFWNEPDGGFAGESAWDFASAMKAAYLGFKSGDNDTPVLVGAMCLFPVRPFVSAALDNDLAEYFDIFNYHTYTVLSDYPSLVGELRKILAAHGVAEMPIWFTEVGTYSEGSARNVSPLPDKKEHDRNQERLVAEFLPKSLVLFQSLGVSRIFPFVMPPFNEAGGSKAWGLLRYDYTAKPAFAALAVLNRQLGQAQYRGEIAAPAGIRAFLFEQPDRRQTVAFWSCSELDTETRNTPELSTDDLKKRRFTLPATNGQYPIFDQFGTPMAATAQNGQLELEASRVIAYANNLTGLNPAHASPRIAPPGARNSSRDKTLVLKTVLSPDFILSAGKSTVDFTTATLARFKLEIVNFSAVEKTGMLIVKGAKVNHLPAQVTVPPWGRSVLELTMDIPVAPEGKIEFGGVFNGREITRLTMHFFKLGAALYSTTLTRSNDPGVWSKNTSGQMAISYDNAEKAIKVDVDFGKETNCWAYPSFNLQLPQEAMTGVVGIEFEIKLNTDPKNALYPLVYFFGANQYTVQERYALPTRAWSTQKVIFENVKEPQRIQMLQIGLGSKGQPLSFSFRNIKFYYRGSNKT